MPSSRAIPQNVEAEQCLLGCLLLDPSTLAAVTATVMRDAFYVDAHRRIFDAIVALDRDHRSIDLVSIADLLRDRGQLDLIGGSSTLAGLAEFVPSAANVSEYASIVHEKAHKRALIHAGTDIAALGFDPDLAAPDAHDRADALLSAARRLAVRTRVDSLGDVLTATYDGIANALDGAPPRFLHTGLAALDGLLDGIEASDVVVLAARPSVGKTALALTIAQNVAQTCKQLGLFSLEMSKQQLANRLLAASSGVDAAKLRARRLAPAELDTVRDAIDRLHSLPLHIIDTSGVSIADVRSCARTMRQSTGLDFLVIDYLQLMSGSDTRSGRVAEVSEISRGVKALARELDIPILLLSQLNRAVEGRDNKVPNLADLRESGSVEQDADIVLMLYRDDYYREDSEKPGEVEVHIKKHRNGPTGKVLLMFNKHTTRFRSIDAYREPPDQQSRAA